MQRKSIMADKWQTYGLDISGITKVVDPIISVLDKGLSTLSNAMKVLTAVLKILQLYITAFGSLSSLIATFVDYTKNTVKKLGQDLENTGVYLNVFVPPAFVTDQANNINYTKLSTGGFNEFLQTLKVSLNSTSDVNCPKFSEQASVGGMLIVVDAETLDAFFRGVTFLQDNLKLTDLLPINTKPSPPKGLKSSAGYFTQPDGSRKFGIQLEWDPPSVRGFTHYKISRSQIPGGQESTTYPIPNKLFGSQGHEKEGLLAAVPIKIQSGSWPAVSGIVYEEKETDPPTTLKPFFNNNTGKPLEVLANPINGRGSIIDYDVNSIEACQYYYVIQSGFAGVNLWSEYSSEIQAAAFPQNCISPNMTGVALHSGGGIHLISVGEKLGQWSAIKVAGIVPFVPIIIETINTLLNSLSGALKTNSKSFLDFIKGIQAKFDKYNAYISTLAGMITALENIFTGLPEIGFLVLPAKSGGTTNFIKRITNATKPAKGFTGPDGITAGIVFVYGNYRVSTDALHNEANFDQQVAALDKTFAAIAKLITG